MQNVNVTVLGTGLMGAPMARNLLKAGFKVTVWNRSRQKAKVLEQDGADVADTPQAAVKDADYVITMLSDGPAVRDLVFDHGVAKAMKNGATLLDMSSIKPSEAREHAELLRAMGLEQLDAPVSGGTKGQKPPHSRLWLAEGKQCLKRPCLFSKQWAGRYG